MTNYKATPAQWQQIENSQVFNGSFQACVLELRSRVERLELRAAYRPKPPNLKEQAFQALSEIEMSKDWGLNTITIRRALEHLDD
jgi:hypothetical protein